MLTIILGIIAGSIVTGIGVGISLLWGIKEELWRIIVLLEDLKACISLDGGTNEKDKWYNQGEEWKQGEDRFGLDDD